MVLKKKKTKTKNLRKKIEDSIDTNIKLLNMYKSKGNRNQAFKNLENKIISQRGNKKADLNDNIKVLNNLARYNLGRQLGSSAPTPNQNLNAVLRQNLLGGTMGRFGTTLSLSGITPELYNRMYNEQIQKQQEKNITPKENKEGVTKLTKDLNTLVDTQLKNLDVTESQKQEVINELSNPSITGFKNIDAILNSQFTSIILQGLINNPTLATLLMLGGGAGTGLLLDKIKKKILESLFGSLIQKIVRKKPKAPTDTGGGSKKDDDDDDDDDDKPSGDKPSDPTQPPTKPKAKIQVPPTTSTVDSTRDRWKRQKQGLDADNQRGLRPTAPQAPHPMPQTTRPRTTAGGSLFPPPESDALNYDDVVNLPTVRTRTVKPPEPVKEDDEEAPEPVVFIDGVEQPPKKTKKKPKVQELDRRALEAELIELNSQLEGFDLEEFEKNSKDSLLAFKGTSREAEKRAEIKSVKRDYERRQRILQQLGLKDSKKSPEDLGAINLDETDTLKKRYDEDRSREGGGGGGAIGFVGSMLPSSVNLKNTALAAAGLGALALGVKKGIDRFRKKSAGDAAREANEAFARDPPFRQQPSRDIFKGMEDKLNKARENVKRLDALKERLQRQQQGRFQGGKTLAAGVLAGGLAPRTQETQTERETERERELTETLEREREGRQQEKEEDEFRKKLKNKRKFLAYLAENVLTEEELQERQRAINFTRENFPDRFDAEVLSQYEDGLQLGQSLIEGTDEDELVADDRVLEDMLSGSLQRFDSGGTVRSAVTPPTLKDDPEDEKDEQ